MKSFILSSPLLIFAVIICVFQCFINITPVTPLELSTGTKKVLAKDACFKTIDLTSNYIPAGKLIKFSGLESSTAMNKFSGKFNYSIELIYENNYADGHLAWHAAIQTNNGPKHYFSNVDEIAIPIDNLNITVLFYVNIDQDENGLSTVRMNYYDSAKDLGYMRNAIIGFWNIVPQNQLFKKYYQCGSKGFQYDFIKIAYQAYIGLDGNPLVAVFTYAKPEGGDYHLFNINMVTLQQGGAKIPFFHFDYETSVDGGRLLLQKDEKTGEVVLSFSAVMFLVTPPYNLNIGGEVGRWKP